MKKKYTISVNEPVLKMEVNRYEIAAESEEDAIEKYNESSAEGSKIIDVKAKSLVFYVVSAVLMLIAIWISWQNYVFTEYRWTLFVNLWPKEVQDNFRPDMQSTLWAVALHLAYIVRIKTVKKVFADPVQIGFSVLIVSLLSGFIKLVLSDIKLLGFALIFSWLGISFASVASYAIILVSSIRNIERFSNVMGAYGYAYVICAYLGLFIYFAQDVDWVYIRQNIINSFVVGSNHVKADYDKTKEIISEIDLSKIDLSKLVKK